jgi:hypothetical protein
MKLKFLGAGAALALGCIGMTIASAGADVIYTYTGNDFTAVQNQNPPPAPQYTKTDSVSGSFTLPTALGGNLPNLPLTTINPTSFSFTDGVQTLTNNTPGLAASFELATNAAAIPSYWEILLSVATPFMTNVIESAHNSPGQTIDEGSQSTSGISGTVNFGYVIEHPGPWSAASTSVAEPGSAWLLAAGLAFLFWRARSATMALVRRRKYLFAPVAS